MDTVIGLLIMVIGFCRNLSGAFIIVVLKTVSLEGNLIRLFMEYRLLLGSDVCWGLI